MTTNRQMAVMYVAQHEVIVALRSIGEPDLAGRLESWLVDWHVSMVASSNVEPCHHPAALVGCPARRCTTAAARSARCPRPDGTSQ
jgi:hypothetical protein